MVSQKRWQNFFRSGNRGPTGNSASLFGVIAKAATTEDHRRSWRRARGGLIRQNPGVRQINHHATVPHSPARETMMNSSSRLGLNQVVLNQVVLSQVVLSQVVLSAEAFTRTESLKDGQA